ncbi:tetratricopeptide repeat protein [Sorangium sp. So ce131]|uniref:tetratricopeptide repeat protein n=1 Tax=Sorangium sp. So ce131 TaxID=3133282 RepID=UPI003F6015E2
MSDPKRWIEAGGGAPEGARELLRVASRPRTMTPAEFTRTAARVGPLGPPTAAGTGSMLPMWVKGIFLAAGIGLGGMAIYGVIRGTQGSAASAAEPAALEHLPASRLLASARDVVGSPEPAAPPAAAPPPEEPARAPEPSRQPPRNTRPAAPAETAAPEGDVGREAKLLEQARAALAQDPAAALAAVNQHRTEFPRGQLVAEREFLAIQVLARLGRADEARTRAEAFLARFPSSPHAERVRRLASAAP